MIEKKPSPPPDIMNDDGANNLRIAIISCAAHDYQRAYKKTKRAGDYTDAAARLKECERFFRSEWFRTLCDLDGEKFMEQLRAAAEAG